MRLSCEKFFVLASVLAAYLLFRDDVPASARLLIRLNHRLSSLFQRARVACVFYWWFCLSLQVSSPSV